MKKKSSQAIFKRSVLSASIAMAASVVALPTFAQDNEEEQEGVAEEITVTGSRIVRAEFEANSPVVTVDADLFQNSSSLAVETVLNQLPQFVPSDTQFNTSQVQNSPTVSAGASTINLRGLGSNRNLVLFDGRRAQPTNALLVVDTNSIPSSAIERVEIVTGGASATYGADAVSGVVNFIMKKNFEGFEIDTQYGLTEQGDGSEARTSMLFGASLGGGQGNVMMGLEYAKRGKTMRDGRDFFERGFADPTVGGGGGVTQTHVNFGAGDLDQGLLDSIFDQLPAGTIDTGAKIFLNDDGTVFTGGSNFGVSDPAGSYRYNGPLGSFRKFGDDGSLQERVTESFISFPLDRYSFFARGHYDLTDDVNIYAQANYTRSDTRSVLLYSPAVFGVNVWGASIPHGTDVYAPSVDASGNTLSEYLSGGTIGVDCPATGGCTNSQAFPTPAEFTALLDSRPDPNAPFNMDRTLDFIGPRATDNRNQLFQVLAGATGQLDIIDGTWDVYASHGETEIISSLIGFGNHQNYRNIVESANYGRGASTGGGFARGTGQCTSGLPIMERFEISDDCRQSIVATFTNVTSIKQTIAEATIQGHLFDLPAGEVRFAAGASYRENEFYFEVPNLNSTLNSDGNSIIGLFPSAGVEGTNEAKDIFAEAVIPVVNDLGFIETFELEVGARVSDYGPDESETYKFLGDMAFNDFFRLRGGYQKATRAPNIGELFSPRAQQVTGSQFGDPCAPNTTASYGANPAFNSNSAAVVTFCEQLMGDPAAAADFYGQTFDATPNTLVTIQEAGNPNIAPESADTWTLGFVASSPFDHALLSDATLIVDWYELEITDVIGGGSYDATYEACFLSGSVTSLECSRTPRNPVTGGPVAPDVVFDNVGAFTTSGFDVQLNWNAELADLGLGDNGSVGINVNLNILDEFLTQETAESPIQDSHGTLADGGQFEWRAFTSFSYFNGPMTASVRWRHFPEIENAAAKATPTTDVQGANVYDVFDFAGSYSFNDTYNVNFGIDNFLDVQPEIVGRTATETAAGSTSSGFYDVLGRRYYVGFHASF